MKNLRTQGSGDNNLPASLTAPEGAGDLNTPHRDAQVVVTASACVCVHLSQSARQRDYIVSGWGAKQLLFFLFFWMDIFYWCHVVILYLPHHSSILNFFYRVLWTTLPVHSFMYIHT